MGIEGGKEVFLVYVIEGAGKALKGLGVCDLKGVVAVKPESFAERKEVVAEEAKLFGVSGLPC